MGQNNLPFCSGCMIHMCPPFVLCRVCCSMMNLIVDENVVSFKRVREKSLCLVVIRGNYFRFRISWEKFVRMGASASWARSGMGAWNTGPSYRRTQNPCLTNISHEILEYREDWKWIPPNINYWTAPIRFKWAGVLHHHCVLKGKSCQRTLDTNE